MQLKDFIALLSETAVKNEYRFENLRERIPLGVYTAGEIATAHREEKPERYHFLIATGDDRRAFVFQLLLSLACFYDENEASFLILSPHSEYAPLLELSSADFSVPYIRTKEDFDLALSTISSLSVMRKLKSGYPRLIVVCDGLEEVQGLKFDDVTDPYLQVLDAVGAIRAEVIAAVDLTASKFCSFPGAVAGIGNCVVSTKADGKADVTQVGADSSLGVPRQMEYPFLHDFALAVRELNETIKGEDR